MADEPIVIEGATFQFYPPLREGETAEQRIAETHQMVTAGSTKWQPIETALKNDERRLFFDDGLIFLGAWDDYFGNFHPEDRPMGFYDEGEGPTHWMPLPDPPAALTSTASAAPSPDPVSPPSTQP